MKAMKAVVISLPMNFLLGVLIVSGSCRAWSPSPSRIITKSGPATARTRARSDETEASRNSTTKISSRRNALYRALTTATLTIGFPTFPAYADVTNKIASTTALRALTRVQGQLSTKLLPVAQSNNYVGVQSCLREPPFNELRKNMLTLVRGAEDGPKATDLSLAYKELIKSLEAIDTTALLGVRGQSDVDPTRMGLEYESVEKAFDAFVKVGTEAVSIPLQI